MQLVVPVFWNTSGMITDPAAPWAWPTDTDNCPVVHWDALAEVVVGELVLVEAGTVVDGGVDVDVVLVVVVCPFFVVVEVVVGLVVLAVFPLPLLQPAASSPAMTTAHPTCSLLRYLIHNPFTGHASLSGIPAPVGRHADHRPEEVASWSADREGRTWSRRSETPSTQAMTRPTSRGR